MRRTYLSFCLLLSLLAGCEMARKEENQSKGSGSSTEAVMVGQKETAQEIGLKIGQQAPDISLPDPDGNLKTLSSLRGKYILVDFWPRGVDLAGSKILTW